MEPYYSYFRGQWLLGKIDAAYIANQVSKGRLTQAEADEIVALPQPA